MKPKPSLYIGIMTGTSVDAIDVALLEFEYNQARLLGTHSHELPNAIKRNIHRLCLPGNNEIDVMGETDRTLGALYAEAVDILLDRSGTSRDSIAAIGCHGQTIRHRTQTDVSQRFSLQIGDPNTLAALSGCTVVADFRRKDIALGGEGAPLAPAFHRYLLGEQLEQAIVLNLGGIANISIIRKGHDLTGFDVGPANTLMDAWSANNQGKDFDENGDWARSGKPNQALLSLLLQHPYFRRRHPKSCGREEFNLVWLQNVLGTDAIDAADVQATLAELSAKTIISATQNFDIKDVFVCGGGIKNNYLMERMAALSPKQNWRSTAELGIAPEWIEASTFAWLAMQRTQKQAGNVPSVSGASRSSVLGAVYLP